MEAPETAHFCYNCRASIPPGAGYCAQCGQKRVARLKSLRDLLHDFFQSVLSLESQTWRTLGLIFLPGRLTERYFQGQRASLLSPLRLFLLVAVAHFAILAFRVHGELGDSLERFAQQQRAGAYDKLHLMRLDTLIRETKTEFPRASEALDTLKSKADARKSMTIEGKLGALMFRKGKFEISDIQLNPEDLLTLTRDDLFAKYQIKDPLLKLQVQMFQRLSQDTDNFVQYILSKLIWMALILIPALALILKLLYLRRGRYFVEHLVFALHYHAFAFGLMALFFLLAFRHPEWLGMVFILIFIYGFLAMKRYYGQGWMKTFMKCGILHFLYIILVTLSQVIIILVSAVLFGNA